MSRTRESREPHPLQRILSHQIPPQAWGGRYFLSNNEGDSIPKRSPLIFTPQYKEPRFFWIQMRFAIDQGILNGPQGQPQLPWSEKMVNAGSAIGQITFTVRRSVNEQGGSLDDVYVVDGAPSTAGESLWFPVMIAPGSQMVIDGENTGDFALWVDASCVPLETLTQEQLIALRWSTASKGTGANGLNSRPNIFGFGTVPGDELGNGPRRRPASAAPDLLLAADESRRQFWISNESTSRLALRFAPQDPDVTPGSESWDVILDAKGGAFSRYQSPVDAYWGEVRGVWEGATPTGFALASAAIYLLQETDTPL